MEFTDRDEKIWGEQTKMNLGKFWFCTKIQADFERSVPKIEKKIIKTEIILLITAFVVLPEKK